MYLLSEFWSEFEQQQQRHCESQLEGFCPGQKLRPLTGHHHPDPVRLLQNIFICLSVNICIWDECWMNPCFLPTNITKFRKICAMIKVGCSFCIERRNLFYLWFYLIMSAYLKCCACWNESVMSNNPGGAPGPIRVLYWYCEFQPGRVVLDHAVIFCFQHGRGVLLYCQKESTVLV